MLGAVFALTTFLKSGLGRCYYSFTIWFEVETCIFFVRCNLVLITYCVVLDCFRCDVFLCTCSALYSCYGICILFIVGVLVLLYGFFVYLP